MSIYTVPDSGKPFGDALVVDPQPSFRRFTHAELDARVAALDDIAIPAERLEAIKAEFSEGGGAIVNRLLGYMAKQPEHLKLRLLDSIRGVGADGVGSVHTIVDMALDRRNSEAIRISAAEVSMELGASPRDLLLIALNLMSRPLAEGHEGRARNFTVRTLTRAEKALGPDAPESLTKETVRSILHQTPPACDSGDFSEIVRKVAACKTENDFDNLLSFSLSHAAVTPGSRPHPIYYLGQVPAQVLSVLRAKVAQVETATLFRAASLVAYGRGANLTPRRTITGE